MTSKKLREDLLALGCKRWSLFADIQYREFYGIRQRIPTAQEYMTAVQSKG